MEQGPSQEPSFNDSRYIFSPSRLGGSSTIYSNLNVIGVFVESPGIIHGWFRFSSGNDRVFVHKVQIICQFNSPSIRGYPKHQAKEAQNVLEAKSG